VQTVNVLGHVRLCGVLFAQGFLYCGIFVYCWSVGLFVEVGFWFYT